MLVHIKDIVHHAQENRYGVGAFNVHNFETIIGVLKGAEEANSPIILQVSEGAIEYMGVNQIASIVNIAAREIALKTPVALHLDHGKDIAIITDCINNGFSSVQIDASSLPLDENINITRQVIDIALKKGVWVQGEVGETMGGHGQVGGVLEGILIAKLEDVIKYVKSTGVDTIAAAVGTAHGSYTNEKIDFDLIKSIKVNTMKPFVLHGGSGNNADDLQKAISLGTNIINIGTDIKVAFSRTLTKTCSENPQETDPRKLLKPTINAVKNVVIEKAEMFGSKGKSFI
jgi:fructose-bisphosphate aldolase, class II